MRIAYKAVAVKQLLKLPKPEQKKILRKIELLSQTPQAGKSLKGELEGLHSLRAWPYRIIYALGQNTITVFSVAHRQSVY